MEISLAHKSSIMGADSKALATTGPHGINVVPVSAVSVTHEYIYLYDFFMKKTTENLVTNSQVALTVWKGLTGLQIKATAAYITVGPRFSEAQNEMKILFPNRVLHGLIVLSPTKIYDISVGVTSQR